MLNPSQNEQQTLLKSFFENGKIQWWDGRRLKIAKKKEAAFKRKYQESYLNDGFIAEVIHILQTHFV